MSSAVLAGSALRAFAQSPPLPPLAAASVRGIRALASSPPPLPSSLSPPSAARRRPPDLSAATVRRLSRKGGRMGHHLETLDELARRGAHEDAKERRRKKKAKRRGERGKHDEDDDEEEEGEEEESAAPGAAPAEGADLRVEQDASETKFDHGAEELTPLPDKDDVKARMMRVVDATAESFRKIRGAEPTPELFEPIVVRAYGALTPLSSVAQVVIASPSRAVLTCYDPETAPAVRDAVRDSGLNFNPRIEDGGSVVVPIPKVSAETRQALVKQLGKAIEASRQRIRRIRRAAQDVVRKGKDGKLEGVSKDDAFRAGKEIDALTEEAIAKLNEAFERKQESIMAV